MRLRLLPTGALVAATLLAACAADTAPGPAAQMPAGTPTGQATSIQQSPGTADATRVPGVRSGGAPTGQATSIQQSAGSADAARVPGSRSGGSRTLARQPVSGSQEGSGASQIPGVTTPAAPAR
jgi:hypothetical protein